MPGKDLIARPSKRIGPVTDLKRFGVGDEHPLHKGWFYTGKTDRKGQPLWYKPPNAFFRLIRPNWSEELRGGGWHVRHSLRDWIARIVLYGFLGLFFLMLVLVLVLRSLGKPV